jgi:hypothetical protein
MPASLRSQARAASSARAQAAGRSWLASLRRLAARNNRILRHFP